MPSPDHDYNMETMIDGTDQVVAIKPPVDNAFREQVYDILDGMGLMEEILSRSDDLFETRHLEDGSLYSELRIDSTALHIITGHRMIVPIAEKCVQVLKDQDKSVEFRHYLIPTRRHKPFESSNNPKLP